MKDQTQTPSITPTGAASASTDVLGVVWIFDINYRSYRQDENGCAYGGPIWRDCWRKHEIVGETKRSWITRWGRKVPKEGGHGIAFSEEEVSREAYIHDNRHKIADRVMQLSDHDILKRVAELVGYETPNDDVTGLAPGKDEQ
jgi:hypothetical protein